MFGLYLYLKTYIVRKVNIDLPPSGYRGGGMVNHPVACAPADLSLNKKKHSNLKNLWILSSRKLNKYKQLNKI